MSSRSAIAKLKAILVIDLIIVAVAAGVYLYFQDQGLIVGAPKPAEFTLTDLTINPAEAEVFEPILIKVNVTNIGEEQGSYMANLTINNVLEENQTILLQGGNSTMVEFTVIKQVEGTYTVEIDGLSSSFNVKAPSPTSSTIGLSDLLVSPSEAWVGDPISVAVTATNVGTESDSLLVKLMVDGVLADSKILQLGAGETTAVEFMVNATSEGKHEIKVNSLTKSLNIVPQGMHTLRILLSPVPDEGGADFTINGEDARTPYYELLSVGEYTISMPAADPTGTNSFLYWGDGSTNPTKRISLTSAMFLVAYYEPGSSCPSLYIWNGTSYVYVAEVSNHGWLGYINHVTGDPDWPIAYWRNNPWDYIPLDKTQLQPNNGYYYVTLTQNWNEIFYLDAAYMLVVDHPSDMNVYSTMVEQYLDPDYMGKIYTVSKNLSSPISAVNEKGENVLHQILEIDDVFTPGINGIQSRSWDDISWNRLTLNLGDLGDAKHVKLVVRGIVDWGSADDYTLWIDKFFAPDVPPGTQITPAPYLEVKDADGNWVRVPESRQLPIPPDGVARTFVVDLTGLFLTDDYSIRISNFWNVTFDYIAVDTTLQETLAIQRINPSANLHQTFATGSVASGNFTRYGDVTELVLDADDMFVIGRQGDEVSLMFPASGLASPEEGMERDFFFYVSLWFKDETGNWGYGFNFTVDPLPFQGMSGFPYPLDTEHYPDDAAHSRYLETWNTRVITAPSQSQALAPWAAWVTGILAVIAVVDMGVLVYFKKRS